MQEDKQVIIFGGDSFTWGEGLELYIPTPKWESEREFSNGWMDLVNKQDSETIQFREQNRFAGIVSEHFNTIPKIHWTNGGQFETPIYLVRETLKKISPNNPKAIIFQFTTLNRMLLHLDMDCECEFCKITGMQKPMILYTDFLHKKLNNIPLTKVEEFGLEYLRDNHNIPFENIDLNIIFRTIDNLFKPIYLENLKLFVEKYVKKWSTASPLYFLDSWDEYTSNVLAEFDVIKNNTIPLKGFDENYYTNWNQWENTFQYKRIVNQFPNTQNGHPTLIQHQYIAESIIEKMNQKNII